VAALASTECRKGVPMLTSERPWLRVNSRELLRVSRGSYIDLDLACVGDRTKVGGLAKGLVVEVLRRAIGHRHCDRCYEILDLRGEGSRRPAFQVRPTEGLALAGVGDGGREDAGALEIDQSFSKGKGIQISRRTLARRKNWIGDSARVNSPRNVGAERVDFVPTRERAGRLANLRGRPGRRSSGHPDVIPKYRDGPTIR